MSDKTPPHKPLDPFAKKFGEGLKAAREDKNMSMSDLAAKMAATGWTNYRAMTISRTEAGTRSVRLDEAIALCDVLGQSLDVLANLNAEQMSLLYRLTRDAVNVENMRMRLGEAIWVYLNQLYDVVTDLRDYEDYRDSSDETDPRTDSAADQTKSLLLDATLGRAILDQVEGTEATGFEPQGIRYVLDSLLSDEFRTAALEIQDRINNITVHAADGSVDPKITEKFNRDLLKDAKPLPTDPVDRGYFA